VTPKTRGEAAGAALRAFLVAGAIAGGVVVAIALLPDLHVWLHLPGRRGG
jgi:hypothetical protein